jgi:hypothetical protein
MNEIDTKLIDGSVKSIRCFHAELELLIKKYRQRIDEYEDILPPGVEKLSGRYWRAVAYVDSLIKLRLFIEQNLSFLETMGVLSVTRYVFELSVWMKLLLKDERYGLAYQYQRLEKQLRFYEDLKGHLLNEIEFFKEIDRKEMELVNSKTKEAEEIENAEERVSAARNIGNTVQRLIDEEAAKTFCLYIEDAFANGFGYQAYLIEQQAIPSAQEGIAGIKAELEQLKNKLPEQHRKFVTDSWQWKRKATEAGMSTEYEFIYSYTSRLLHATPPSLTTNQKNLSPQEINMFLRYIDLRMKEAIDDAKKLLAHNEAAH